MKLTIFTLCDCATVDAGGKLNILGSFDRINAATMPLVYPFCCLAIKMSFDKIEEGSKRLRVSFIDDDGNSVMGMEAQVHIAFSPGESNASLPLVIGMPQIKLSNFGEYSIGLAIDGDHKASIPLFVRQAPQSQPPQLPPPPETPHPE